jgi:hypothetical protein
MAAPDSDNVSTRHELTGAASNGGVVHPATGEILDPLAIQSPEKLAEMLISVRELQDKLKRFGAVVEDELRGRMETRGRNAWIIGDYGLEIEVRNETVWDGDELEGVLRELVDEGVVNAGELTEVIRHKTEVSRTEANRLVGRLASPARDAVERCRRWERVSRGRVKVVRQVPLIQEKGERPPSSKAA